MNQSKKIKLYRRQLLNRYKLLIEDAYNFRQTDAAKSDISEYKALRLLDKLNRLKFLEREIPLN